MRKHYPLNSAGEEDAGALPWTNGVPETGTEGSYPPHELCTEPEAELLAAIDASGQVRSSTDLTQLIQAISRGIYLGALGGSPNALSGTIPNSVTVPALLAGMRFSALALANNTAATTVTLSGFAAPPGAKSLLRRDGAAIQSGDVRASEPFEFRYDGSAFRLIAPARSEILESLIDQPGSDLKLNQGLFLLKAQRSAGVNPRVLSSSFQAWRLNYIARNTITGASIDNVGGGATYRITLPAGRYRVFGIGQANRSGQHRCRLYNVTDSAVIDTGTTADGYANNVNGTTNPSILEAFFDLSATKQITFDHAGLDTSEGDAYFGDSDGSSANTDAYLRILREIGQP